MPTSSGSGGSSPTSSNRTLTHPTRRRDHHAKKGLDRAGEGRSADLVDVGLERRGEEGCSHGGDLLEASRSGHWAPARRVDDGYGKLAIRRRRRSCSLGFSLLERLNYENFLNFISMPWYDGRWLDAPGAKGAPVACPRRLAVDVAACCWFE